MGKDRCQFVSTYTVRERPVEGVKFVEPSRTKQSFKDECDINLLMKRYGTVPAPTRVPQFGDFSEIGTFFDARLAVLEAEQEFMTLPAKVRSRFDNDPGKLLAFLEDERNRAEAISLGLVEARAVPGPEPEADPAKKTAEKPSGSV